MTQRRRNISHSRTRSEPPYNELYEAFKPFFAPIFTERLSEGLRAKTYVNVPEVESELDSYLDSDLTGIAVLSGLMGSGKSSILEHYADSSNGDTANIFVYLNFAGRRYHFMPAEDFIALSAEDRRLYARAQATRRLNELLLEYLKENINLIDVPYFDFLLEYNIAELGAPALFARDDEEKMDIVRKFMSDPDQTAPMQCFLRYLCHVKKVHSFTLAIDNVDEQPFELVEGLFFVLTDFVECMMRPRRGKTSEPSVTEENPYGISTAPSCSLHDTRFRAILACRTHTFEALKLEEGGIYQTRGCEEINLTAGSILVEILRSRIAFFKKVLEDKQGKAKLQQRPYTLKSGANIQLEEAFAFLESFVTQMLEKTLETPLFGLFNHNYARCIQNIKYVIQNRYFLLFDSAVMHAGSVELEFRYLRVIRALGYGNPESAHDLYFPTQSCVITNILTWDPGIPGSFLSVIKFLMWLGASGFTGEACADVTSCGCTVAHAVRTMESQYGVNEKAAVWTVAYCHKNGLVFAASGYKSSLCDDEALCMSPKGRTLLNEFFRTDVFFEMYIDDIFPISDVEALTTDRPPVQAEGVRPRRQHFEDKLKWLRGFLDAERRLLEDLKRSDREFVFAHVKLFDGMLFTHKFACSFDGFYEQHYKNFCTRRDRASLNDFLKLCEDATSYFSARRT